MFVKVCGMRNAENVKQIASLAPDYMGFIFYPKSKRFVGEDFDATILQSIPASIKKIGVFVNEEQDRVIEIAEQYQLDGIQLHGDESALYVSELSEQLTPETLVIKVFQVDESFDFNTCEPFMTNSDYFLFDTKSPQYGGTGHAFNWNILEHYTLDKPFFLSGGITAADAKTLTKLASMLPMLHTADINSRFETEPGLKSIALVKNFIESQKLQ